MEHLSTEVLASLMDQTATEEEYRHLADCPACRGELNAMREQCEALGRLPDLRPPPGDWTVLQARLVSEGLVRGGGRFGYPGFAAAPAWMKVAAALVLFLGGAVAGGVAANGSGLPFGQRSARDGGLLMPVEDVRSADDAFQWVQLAERRYMDALVRYRQLKEGQAGAPSISDVESRYAALEYIVRAGRAALREAPADPFLNGLVASATAEREFELKRISSSRDNWF